MLGTICQFAFDRRRQKAAFQQFAEVPMRNIRLDQRIVLTLAAAMLPIVGFVALGDEPVKARRPAMKGKVARPLTGGKRLVSQAAESTSPASESAPVIKGQATSRKTTDAPESGTVAAAVDRLIAADLQKANADVAPRCSDEDFLRRVSLDIAGVLPTPQELTLFGLDPDPNKRSAAIDRLLASGDYADHWAHYWRDVIQSRATETRLQFTFRSFAKFESWMKDQLAANRPWDEITTAILTATGDTSEEGQTALILAQRGEPAEIAAETSRVFLGIQLQCANCHDHPNDSWKREQFHSLAAFFPRVRLQQSGQQMQQKLELVSFTPDGAGRGRGDLIRVLATNPDPFIRRLDRDGDHKISKEEAKQGPNGGGFAARLFELGADTNQDGFLTVDEIKKAPIPQMTQPGQGSAEYHMPDLQQPQSEGKKMDPTFFLGDLMAGSGLGDLDRRRSLANYITAAGNPWFAKAFVNRVWGQLVGEGFYMPIDDMGPERTASHAGALEALSSGFTASGYDIAWLFRVIANTETYQREIRSHDPGSSAAFASAAPVRLRADQLYKSLVKVLGLKEEIPPGPMGPGMGMYRPNQPFLRLRVEQLFGFDPSTSPDELNGTIPQALFMMNSGLVNGLTRAAGQTRLGQILEKFKSDDDALAELYLVVYAREPSDKESKLCRDYIAKVNNRQEAFEDIFWSLLNSTEFQTKR
jgi:hypothetical protein